MLLVPLARENFCIRMVRSLYPPSLKGAPKDTMNKRRKFFLLSIGLFPAQHLGQQCIKYVTADTKDRIAKNTL